MLKAYRTADEKHLLADLIEKAESQGYLTTEDIMEAFSENDGPDQMDEMFAMLHNAGVEVYDEKGDLPEESHFDDLYEESSSFIGDLSFYLPIFSSLLIKDFYNFKSLRSSSFDLSFFFSKHKFEEIILF